MSSLAFCIAGSGTGPLGGDRLEDQQLEAGQVLVFPGDDDVAEDFRELHAWTLIAGGDFNRVNDADDRGVDGAILQA